MKIDDSVKDKKLIDDEEEDGDDSDNNKDDSLVDYFKLRSKNDYDQLEKLTH